MRTSLCALAVAASLSLILPATAQTSKLVGVWKVESVVDTDSAKQTTMPLGDHPTGYAIYTKGGHVVLVQSAADRPAPAGPVPTDAEAGKLIATMVAFSGTYKSAGKGKIIIREETAWNQTALNTNLVRGYKIVGKKLMVTLDIKNAAGQDLHRTATFIRVE